MAVSHPMITDLKECAARFLEDSEPITDDCKSVRPFCESLERILESGVLQQGIFGWKIDSEPWQWLKLLARDKYGATYTYQLLIEKVQNEPNTYYPADCTRQLIRHCLNKRCLHVPFQILLETKMFEILYSQESVLGNEILSQILLSVIQLPSSLQFKLDTDNARFLDETWALPTTKRLTLVPTNDLGFTFTNVETKPDIQRRMIYDKDAKEMRFTIIQPFKEEKVLMTVDCRDVGITFCPRDGNTECLKVFFPEERRLNEISKVHATRNVLELEV